MPRDTPDNNESASKRMGVAFTVRPPRHLRYKSNLRRRAFSFVPERPIVKRYFRREYDHDHLSSSQEISRRGLLVRTRRISERNELALSLSIEFARQFTAESQILALFCLSFCAHAVPLKTSIRGRKCNC